MLIRRCRKIHGEGSGVVSSGFVVVVPRFRPRAQGSRCRILGLKD